MKPSAHAEEHNQQNPEDSGIWTHAPLARQIHEEWIQAMKVTMAEVNAKIKAIALASTPLAKTEQ